MLKPIVEKNKVGYSIGISSRYQMYKLAVCICSNLYKNQHENGKTFYIAWHYNF